MKFFKKDLYIGNLSEKELEGRFSNYQEHLRTIEASLTHNLRKFFKTENIHDGLTRSMVIDRAAARIQWNLRCGDLQVGYYDLDITFQNVTVSDSFVTHVRKVINSAEAELLYDEIDLTVGGNFRYGILIFCAKHVYEEIEFEFSDLNFSHINCSGRTFVHLSDRIKVI
jgi:hypothetical protein